MARIGLILPAFASGELSPRLFGRVDYKKYASGLETLENFIVLPQGGVIRRPGTRYAGRTKFGTKTARLVPFEFSTVQAYVLEFGDGYLRVWKDHGQVEASPGVAYEIVTPYSEADLDELSFAQSADVLYIAHPSHQPAKLSRTGHTAWTLTSYRPDDGPFLERNADASKTISVSGETGSVSLSASASIFDAGQIGGLFFIQMKDLAAVPPWESDSNKIAVGDYCRWNGNYYKATVEGAANKTGTVPPTHEEGLGYDGLQTQNVQWEFLHKGYGVVRITAVASGTSATATVLRRLPHTLTSTASPHWAEGAWSAYRGWPSCVSFHEQRLFFANTPTRPQTVWGSRSGDYERFESGAADDDAVVYGIASNQVNAIRWLASNGDLIVGTVSQEFAASGGAAGDPITPSSVRIVPQSAEGSSTAEPARLGGEVLFVNRAGRRLVAALYDYEFNGYRSEDLTLLADHLTSSSRTIVRTAWAREPLRTLWCVRSDGSLLALTYRRSEEIFAWGRHPMDGLVESVAVIPTPDGTSDELWLTVRRVVNGVVMRQVCYMLQPFEPAYAGDKLGLAFLDASLEYAGPPADTLSGLDHLEGRTVAIVADGALHPERVVSGGQIVLEREVEMAQVGLPFASTLKTLRLEGGAIGTAQGKMKRIARVTVRLNNSLGGEIGSDKDHLEPLLRRDLSDPTDASPPLFTGDVDVRLASDWETNGQLTIVQREPLPLEIVAVMPQLSVSEG